MGVIVLGGAARRCAIATLPCFLIGCSQVLSTGVRYYGDGWPDPDGLYMIRRSNTSNWNAKSLDELKEENRKEAAGYCELRKRRLKVHEDLGIVGRAWRPYTESELVFKCEK